MALLKYAIQKETEDLVSIDDVTNGLSCNCICPSCKENLIANQGGLKQWYFSHKSKIECEYAGQTVAHLIAKDIIKKHGVYIPSHPLMTDELLAITGKIVVFDKVLFEKKFHDFIPDIIGIKDGVQFVIEVAVTHFCDDEKLLKIENSCVNAIEIDLSHLKNTIDKDNIREFILDSTRPDYFNWLNFNKCPVKETLQKAKQIKQEIVFYNELLKSVCNSIEKVRGRDNPNYKESFYLRENGNFTFRKEFRSNLHKINIQSTVYKTPETAYKKSDWAFIINVYNHDNDKKIFLNEFMDAEKAKEKASECIKKEVNLFLKNIEKKLVSEKLELENKIFELEKMLNR